MTRASVAPQPTTATRAQPVCRPVSRPLWSDRFRHPTPAQLVAALPPATRPLVAQARTALQRTKQTTETASWLGTWHWAIEFRHRAAGAACWAYLIPDPQRPQFCVPVQESRLGQLAARVVTRDIQDRLVHCPLVAGVRWASWTFDSRAQVERLIAFAQACLFDAQTSK